MKIDQAALDLLFLEARSQNGWASDQPEITDEMLERLYDVVKWGPTSANCSPARFVFVRSEEGKERMRPALSSGNTEKATTAPVTVIVAYDSEFHEKLPQLFPHSPDAKNWFTTSEQLAYETAFRNGTLQGAYLILAARAMGLDCGPMSGFDNAKMDEIFFKGTSWRSNFLISLGKGDPSKLFGRHPKLAFGEACQVL